MLPFMHKVFGGFLVITGAILTPTPIPVGLILLTIGLALLAPYMTPVQALVRTIRRKWPHIDASLLKHHHRFPPVIRSTIDRTHPAPKSPAE
ncbi:MAG: hypothetical protein GC153_10195 [Alphaproteobacteria bacterium]|nr:hypothetical protein [Alphaproteobacteria bacterium]